ncbi:DUF3189 family protein [Desulforudis sp. 1088]|uniref:DUF3189 family protein n=1 Tax=unclassified Candidatus Desulforudis TaxID=2635950 RepID=UPI003498CDA0
MKILYHCFGGTHSSVLAAALHLRLLDPRRRPSDSELKTLPFFDKRAGSDYGRIAFYGRDEQGREIWILGRLGYARVTEGVFSSLLHALIENGRQLLVDTTPILNWQMRVGGYLSRRARWKRIGFFLIAQGTRKAYPRLVQLVKQAEEEIDRIEGLTVR